MQWQKIKSNGGLAVITGGASGVGLASAKLLAAEGFEILLADRDEQSLATATQDLRDTGAQVHARVVDVSDRDAVFSLANDAFEIGPVAVVMNNAGIGAPSSTWEDIEAWHKNFEVNLFGILNGVQAFVPRLIDAGSPAVVINTGSKQGITTPPGNPAYNASKAAVKVLTEQLAHELRQENAPIDVHLFVPGFTYTGMIASFIPEKPDGAWTSEETVAYLFEKVAEGNFYILCPDNMVTEAVDARRVLWNAHDIAQSRPPLSRWHPDWADAFSKFESE